MRLFNKISYLFGKLKWRLVQLLTKRQKVHSRGLVFSLPCDNWITHYRWNTFNEKEPETLDWIDQSIKDGSVFFDIGANIGIYSIYATLRHPKLKTFAFEPEYSNLHLLRDNLVANQLLGRVTPFSIGIGRQRSLSHIHVQDLTPGAALHTVSDDNLEKTHEGKIVVLKEGISVWSIDQFCSEIGLRPNFMKIDVDGTEKEVLDGGIKTFSDPEFSSLIIEASSDQESREYCDSRLVQTGLKKVFEEIKFNYQIWRRT